MTGNARLIVVHRERITRSCSIAALHRAAHLNELLRGHQLRVASGNGQRRCGKEYDRCMCLVLHVNPSCVRCRWNRRCSLEERTAAAWTVVTEVCTTAVTIPADAPSLHRSFVSVSLPAVCIPVLHSAGPLAQDVRADGSVCRCSSDHPLQDGRPGAAVPHRSWGHSLPDDAVHSRWKDVRCSSVGPDGLLV